MHKLCEIIGRNPVSLKEEGGGGGGGKGGEGRGAGGGGGSRAASLLS